MPVEETDAKDWYDSKQTLVRACQADLSHAKRVRGLCQPGARSDPEYEELRKALQRNYRVLFYTYKHYCSSDAQFGPFLMTWNAFKSSQREPASLTREMLDCEILTISSLL